MKHIPRIISQTSVRLVAALTAAMGLVNVLSAIEPAFIANIAVLHQFVPTSIRYDARIATVLAGFGLLLLSAGLWRRKRVAWYMAVTLLIVSAIVHIVKGLDIIEASLALLLGGWLYLLRWHFQATSDQPSVRQGIVVLFISALFTLVYGTTGLYILDRHFAIHFLLLSAIQQTLLLFFGFAPIATTNFGRHFIDSIYIVSFSTLIYSFWLLLRPYILRASATSQERTRATQIVREFGRSQLAEFVLFPDKHYFFSTGGSTLGFTVHGRIALVLGDPIGPISDLGKSIGEFLSHCQRHDWLPAFYQTSNTTVQHYEQHQLKKILIGHEAIVDLQRFSLAGSQNKELRNTFHRLQRLGYTSEHLRPPIDGQVLLQLREVSDDWLEQVQGTEKQFSLGRFDWEYLKQSPVSIVRSPVGEISAFVSLIGSYSQTDVAIDLMRRRSQTENGVMDYLLINLLDELRQRGYRTVDLGLNSLAEVGHHSTDTILEHALKLMYNNLNLLYQARGLRSFKDKFHPIWTPRYLIVPSLTNLPAVAVALILAHTSAPQDFIETVWQTIRLRINPSSTSPRV